MTDNETYCPAKAARTCAEQDHDVICTAARDCEIKLAVPVKIGKCECAWQRADTEVRRKVELSVSSADEHRNIGRVGVRHCEIVLSVSIEVTRYDGIRGITGKQVHRRTERARASAEQDRDAPRRISRSQIKLSVTVKVFNRNRSCS